MLQRGQGNLLPQPGIFFWLVLAHTGTPTQSSIILTLQASRQLPWRHSEHSRACSMLVPAPVPGRKGEAQKTDLRGPCSPCGRAAGPSCPVPGLRGAGWRCRREALARTAISLSACLLEPGCSRKGHERWCCAKGCSRGMSEPCHQCQEGSESLTCGPAPSFPSPFSSQTRTRCRCGPAGGSACGRDPLGWGLLGQRALR